MNNLAVLIAEVLVFLSRMNRYLGICLGIVYTVISVAQSVETHHHETQSSEYAYEFIPNHGQWHPKVLYKASIPFGNLFLESDGIKIDLVDTTDYHEIQEHFHLTKSAPKNKKLNKHAVKLQFSGMEYAPYTMPQDIQKHYYNYYLGSDSTKWVSKIFPAHAVVYKGVYSDVDFKIDGNGGIKYEWQVKKPTLEKIDQIAIRVQGADNLSLVNGDLYIKTSVGIIKEAKPFIYQWIGNRRVEIASKFTLEENSFGFELLQDFDPNIPLIIDPKLIFSTYSGSTGDNFGFTATYDSRGSLYSGGIVDNRGYPVTTGAYVDTFSGGIGRAPANLSCDIAISKYDSAGSTLLWATYLGGNDDEYPHSLVADADDNLVILGTTYSRNFPTSTNAYDDTRGGSTDIIVTKLSKDGTTLLGSTYIGGNGRDGLTLKDNQNYRTGDIKYNYADDYRGDIITDTAGNIYVASMTASTNLQTVKAIQSGNNGDLDAYIFELSPDCSELLWATYFGGSEQDAFYSIKLKDNKILLGGGTSSPDVVTKGDVFSDSHLGNVDGLLAIFDTAKTLTYCTYWGTSEYDQIYFIDLDAEERIYATGQTEGNLLKTPNTFGDAGKGQFVFRIDTTLKTIDLQTTFGNTIGKPNLVPTAFLVDICGHIYFSGWGSLVAAGFNPGSTGNMPITQDAIQKTTDENDFYIIVFAKDAESLLYATYYGGDITGDHVDGGTSRFDKKGVIYQSVCSSCPPGPGQSQISDFPTSPGAAFETNPSVRCSNASLKIDLQISTGVEAKFSVFPREGCNPLTVQLENNSSLGDTLFWDFGDGTQSSEFEPTHTYTEPGTYTITLVVVDSNSCNISSQYERTVIVREQSSADFTVSFEGCNNDMRIENLSENAFSYRWDFGDGGESSVETPEYEYSEGGNYTITLYVNEGTICESQHEETVNISDKVEPSISLYNIFTPDGDGKNDCFRFDGTQINCGEYRWKVYNRWGEKIFEANDPLACWNGKINNERLAPEGTYFYLLWYGAKGSNPISGQIEVNY